MIIRVLTDTNYLDIELKEPVDEELIVNAMSNMEIILFENKQGNKVFINPVNIVSLEVINIPPIQ